MRIEFEFNSVTVQPQELQENLPALISKIQSFLPAQETPKKRRRRRKKTVGSLIDKIIDSIEK